jgi:hypothetical protein
MVLGCKGWVLAAELQAGDQVQQSDGNSLTIDHIRVIRHGEKVKVYNFTVADFHTYYVSDLGIRVHNVNGCGPEGAVPKVGGGKSKNNMKYDPDATGEHSTF